MTWLQKRHFQKWELGTRGLVSASWEPRDWTFSPLSLRTGGPLAMVQAGCFLGPFSVCAHWRYPQKPAPVPPATPPEAAAPIPREWVVEAFYVAADRDDATEVARAVGTAIETAKGNGHPGFGIVNATDMPKPLVEVRASMYRMQAFMLAKAGHRVESTNPETAAAVERMFKSILDQAGT